MKVPEKANAELRWWLFVLVLLVAGVQVGTEAYFTITCVERGFYPMQQEDIHGTESGRIERRMGGLTRSRGETGERACPSATHR